MWSFGLPAGRLSCGTWWTRYFHLVGFIIRQIDCEPGDKMTIMDDGGGGGAKAEDEEECGGERL